MRALLGFQIAAANGQNIQGDDGDPSGHPSFRILSMEEAVDVVSDNPELGLLLMPIHEGDTEEPESPA